MDSISVLIFALMHIQFKNSPTARVEITEIWLENEYTRLSNKAIRTSPTFNISISTLTQAIIFYI